MQEKLDLKEVYSSVYDKQIGEDFNNLKTLILSLSDIKIKCITVQDLERFLVISNEIMLYINKLKTFFYLKLYLNTKIKIAGKKINDLSKLEDEFNKENVKLAKILTKEMIDDFALKSNYILNHKAYLLDLVKKYSYTPYSYNEKLEQEYQKILSQNKVKVYDKEYPLNLSAYDFISDDKLLKICEKYKKNREQVLRNTGNEFAKILVEIKKETIKYADSFAKDSPLQMSVNFSNFDIDILNNLIDSLEKNKQIIDEISKINQTLQFNKKFTKKEIRNILISSFNEFDNTFGTLLENIFAKNYIDLSNRKNKILGACHLKILCLKQSRIIAHSYGNLKEIFQIAHEVGHAYHNSFVMKNITPINSEIPTAICEVISIFSELVLFDCLLNNESNTTKRDTIKSYFINYFVQATYDVLARFKFEDYVFNKLLNNNNNNLSFDDLCDKMLKIQKDVYLDNDKYIDKFLWVYKPHFYLVDNPYYNYPYAFGILYAILLFIKYKTEEKDYFIKKLALFCEKSSTTPINKLSEIFGIDLYDKNCYDKSYEFIVNIIKS